MLDFFSSSILSNVSLNRSLEKVHHYCFSFLKFFLPSCAAWGETSLITTVWDIKNIGIVGRETGFPQTNISKAFNMKLFEKIIKQN